MYALISTDADRHILSADVYADYDEACRELQEGYMEYLGEVDDDSLDFHDATEDFAIVQTHEEDMSLTIYTWEIVALNFK